MPITTLVFSEAGSGTVTRLFLRVTESSFAGVGGAWSSRWALRYAVRPSLQLPAQEVQLPTRRIGRGVILCFHLCMRRRRGMNR